jgi:hypothetical protein
MHVVVVDQDIADNPTVGMVPWQSILIAAGLINHLDTGRSGKSSVASHIEPGYFNIRNSTA